MCCKYFGSFIEFVIRSRPAQIIRPHVLRSRAPRFSRLSTNTANALSRWKHGTSVHLWSDGVGVLSY